MKFMEWKLFTEQSGGTKFNWNLPGKDVIIDFKQSNKPKKTDYIQDYLQLGICSIWYKNESRHNFTLYKRYLFQELKLKVQNPCNKIYLWEG